MFSIIIPTYNNLEYLKICINSILKNSNSNHEIIVHINEGKDGTEQYLVQKKIKFTFTKRNVGLCEGVNLASKKSTRNYIMYSHDDFYFCPNWDKPFFNEIKKIKNNKFYLSGTMFDYLGKTKFFCGNNYKNFNEKKLLSNLKKINFNDYQGSTWAPHLVHKKIWNKVGGFSEEFFPGAGSDPDFAMKLWNQNIRIFKSLGKSLIYHFGSKTLRKKRFFSSKNNLGSQSSKKFICKWGLSINFFRKHYLKSGSLFVGQLDEPKKNILYWLDFLKSKFKFYYYKIL